MKYTTKNFKFIHRNAKKSKKTIQKGWNPF
uniref:Uncharacterized protein n=1 Tax=virus sp. ct1Uu26 TaxID=2826789 RepID=A0A8S5R7W6_9VIRU|nr:MAG TPA: hypothetical protein [virus sp. ct1Uu26]